MSIERLARDAVDEHYAMQDPDELFALGWEIRQRLGQPRTVLEIGSNHGGVLWFFSQLAADDAMLISLDRDQSHNRMQGRAEQLVCKLQVDSGDHANYAWMRYASFDLLFIDGDHTLTAVERDYRMYAPLVRPGGLVAVHDVGFSSAEVWKRIHHDGQWSRKFVYQPQDHKPAGIGVMCVS